MKRLSDVSPMSGKVGLPLRYLVVAMAAMIALPVAQADVAGKKIGDLEIYKAAEGGKTTITMMLDTSGSEPPRYCRRLNILREYNDENTTLHPRD